jgi:hypothetical protein
MKLEGTTGVSSWSFMGKRKKKRGTFVFKRKVEDLPVKSLSAV